jgi:hypothetical protein
MSRQNLIKSIIIGICLAFAGCADKKSGKSYQEKPQRLGSGAGDATKDELWGNEGQSFSESNTLVLYLDFNPMNPGAAAAPNCYDLAEDFVVGYLACANKTRISITTAHTRRVCQAKPKIDSKPSAFFDLSTCDDPKAYLYRFAQDMETRID